VIAPSAEGILGQYLRNALHCDASAELLKPIADAAPTVLGAALADATDESLDRALGALPPPYPGGEPLERNARFAAAEFGFSHIELDILLLALRLRRNRSLARFCSAVQDVLRDPMRTIAALLGHDLEQVQSRLAAGAPLLICGLIELDPDESYGTGFASVLAISPAAAGPMFAAQIDRDAWRAALIGRPCQPDLPWSFFGHLGEAPPLAVRVLAAAALAGEAGVHVLLFGPPGTGKSQLARALAARAGLTLYAAGEATDAGEEPSRATRSAALRLSLALLRRRRDAAVLLDEAEDVLDAPRSFGVRRGVLSKLFLNRTLELAAVPVIWTCNEIGWMDPATLRRMTLVLRMPVPDAGLRAGIWQRVLAQEGLALPPGTPDRLAANWPVSAGVAAGAARAARLAGGGLGELELALAGVAEAVGSAGTDTSLPPARFDPALTVCAEDLEALCARLARPGAPRAWSLCLSGPSGTGKTAFGHHLAGQLALPVLQKRASDLLSMWVGGSERAIANAFAEARTRNALLLIDEAEALLFDRAAAQRSFEVSQVDELLTWMERHPLPFVCTTNLPERLDGAVPRRFTLKLRFGPLDPVRAALAFRCILGSTPPGVLPEGLTPGDFAVVRRKSELLEDARPERLAAWLMEELAAKMDRRAPIGFRAKSSDPLPPDMCARDAA